MILKPGVKQALWFLTLWLAGVALTAAIGLAIKLVLV